MSVTIFIAGIHGAGKSTISRELAKLLGASHVTAGDLIRASASATNKVTVGVKAVPNVDANQQLLIRGWRCIGPGTQGRCYWTGTSCYARRMEPSLRFP